MSGGRIRIIGHSAYVSCLLLMASIEISVAVKVGFLELTVNVKNVRQVTSIYHKCLRRITNIHWMLGRLQVVITSACGELQIYTGC